MTNHNYLIGFGERLVQPIEIKSGGGPKIYPYSFDQAKHRLTSQWQATESGIKALPELACPKNQTVISLTLHPAFLAKSYYPSNLLRDLDLQPVGSRARHIIPEKTTKKSKGGAEPAPEIFVAGRRDALSEFVKNIPHWQPSSATKDDFRKIENVGELDLSRLKTIEGDDTEVPLEIVLHANKNRSNTYVLEGFEAFINDLGLKINFDQRLHAGGLCFLPMYAPRELLEELTRFSFIRVVRRMPRLSLNEDILRSATIPGSFRAHLPKEPALNKDVRVAIFDGGLPEDDKYLSDWSKRLEAPGVGPHDSYFQAHGLGVTSALLFGPLQARSKASVPYTNVDHWRVLDKDLPNDDFELITVLQRIINVLRQREYDFVNLSIGPDLPIEDDEVHVWTATLDEYLAETNVLLTTACGNSGEDNWESGNARIQPSADAVNGLGIGAADTREKKWSRASYSSIGPGRSPGFVKPDLLAFGGSEKDPFWLLDANNPGRTIGKKGTSYAAPFALRSGTAIKAHFGRQLSATAIKALMLHHSIQSTHPTREVGWGRIPLDLDELVVCREGEATIVYQGTLEPSQWMRFPIPIPSDGFSFRSTIKATFCFFTAVDPEDSLNYTRAGLSIHFRPSTFGHPGYYPDGKPRSSHPTKSFFRSADYYQTEAECRRDAYKWEATLKDQRNFNAGTLNQPVFDVEHQARQHGQPTARRTDIPYALILTISSQNEPNLYNRILAAYRTQLEVLQPIVDVPVRIKR